MATPGAIKRLNIEYANIQKNPPPYITAHPSESNILEWHYIVTGPPDTPYHGGQYWGTLVFPPTYPFAPPAIRMHTPSGRFQSGSRLCLSISDFHPKTFNPAWEVSTILLGLLSFMASDEITTGSIRASDSERRLLAAKTRWWNSTGGGSTTKTLEEVAQELNLRSESNPSIKSTTTQSTFRNMGSLKSGDGGAKFCQEFPEIDLENWKWMIEKSINPRSGVVIPQVTASPLTLSTSSLPLSPTSTSPTYSTNASPSVNTIAASAASAVASAIVTASSGSSTANSSSHSAPFFFRRRDKKFSAPPSLDSNNISSDSSSTIAATTAAVAPRATPPDQSKSTWFFQNKYTVGAFVLFTYVLLTRIFGRLEASY